MLCLVARVLRAVPWGVTDVRLGELCAATSLFTDLGTGQPSGHGLRACVVALRLAERLGLDVDDRREVFYVALLRFLGCTADAERVAALSGGDETVFLAGMAPVTMGAPRAEVVRLVALAGSGQPVVRRARAIVGALTDPRGKARLLGVHCEVAARLAAEIGLPPGVTDALRVAYARWDGRGVPADVGGTGIPVSVRVCVVARDIELWLRDADSDATRRAAS